MLKDLISKKISFQFIEIKLLIFISIYSFICFSQAGQGQIYKLKATIDTQITLTKALAIDQINDNVIVGSHNGQLNIFNYKTGKIVAIQLQSGMEIHSIIWIKDRDGLITVSVDRATNKSLAIIRDPNTFAQIYRWQFNELVINVDYAFTSWHSFIAFNFGHRIDQYNLRLKTKIVSYNLYSRKAYEIKYTSNYNFLVSVVNDPNNNFYIEVFYCGRTNGWFYGGLGNVSALDTDKYDPKSSPFIIKSNTSQFYVMDQTVYHPSKFPTNVTIGYFKYCPQKYIVGVSIDRKVILYSRDYNFTEIASIDYFTIQNLQIITVECKMNHLIISTTNNQLYVYQFQPFDQQQAIDWLKIGTIAGLVLLVLLVIGIIIFRKIRRAKLNKKIMENQDLIETSQTVNL